MNAPVTVKAARSVDELHQFFAQLCEHRAELHAEGILTLHEAVDELQAFATLSGLVEAISQQSVQETMAFDGDVGMVDACEYEIHLRTANLVQQWELADPRDRWRWTGEPRPIAQPEQPARREPYPPPQATIDAFFFLARQQDADCLARWLAARPTDAPALYKIWKSSRC
jgi:hypothetical protein